MKVASFLGVVAGVALLLAGAQAWTKRYDGYQVLEVVAQAKFQVELLHHMEQRNQVDIGGAMVPGAPIKVMVAPQHLRQVQGQMTLAGLKPTVYIQDVQKQFDAEEPWVQRKISTRRYDQNDFNTYEDILDEMDNMVVNCPMGFDCSVDSIGKSYEGRDILVLSVKKSGSRNPVLWLDSTVHAREWLTTTTIMRIMDHMVNDYGSSDEVTSLLDNYEWHFLPVANPDGYTYSWTNDRLYRKNRRPNPSGCVGTDLNRNFEFKWGLEGVSNWECSEIYCGPSPGSEPETDAMQKAIMALSDRMMAFVTFHAYGYMWMFPWGYTENHQGFRCARADDHDDMMEVADATADAIMATYNDDYWLRGTSCEVIYETTGASDDWAKGVAGVKYSFNPELRGPWFDVSSSNIEPAFRETFNGIFAMVKAIDAKEGYNKL